MDPGNGAVLQHGERWSGRRVEVRGQHARRLQLLFGRGNSCAVGVPRCGGVLVARTAFRFRAVYRPPRPALLIDIPQFLFFFFV